MPTYKYISANVNTCVSGCNCFCNYCSFYSVTYWLKCTYLWRHHRKASSIAGSFSAVVKPPDHRHINRNNNNINLSYVYAPDPWFLRSRLTWGRGRSSGKCSSLPLLYFMHLFCWLKFSAHYCLILARYYRVLVPICN